MAKKEIDFTALQKAIADMDSAIAEFDPCYKEFVGSVMSSIEGNNSDFMVSLEKVLRAFKDNKAKKALEAVKRSKDDIQIICEGMEAVDQAVAQKIKEGEKS